MSFSGDFHNFRNYGPDFHLIYGIMILKFTRIYGIKGTNFSGKMARPRQMICRDTPPPSILWIMIIIFKKFCVFICPVLQRQFVEMLKLHEVFHDF